MENKLLIGLIILLAIVLIVFLIGYAQIKNSEEKKDYCEQDSDCTIQPTCCCYEAINKKFVMLHRPSRWTKQWIREPETKKEKTWLFLIIFLSVLYDVLENLLSLHQKYLIHQNLDSE